MLGLTRVRVSGAVYAVTTLSCLPDPRFLSNRAYLGSFSDDAPMGLKSGIVGGQFIAEKSEECSSSQYSSQLGICKGTVVLLENSITVRITE
ncbi:hypothetical protein TNCV_1708491 [Trichonephila clavipes]|nr:hypothetical protein TNCV_1708491 [Trichonephila clavipes]